jgi:MerR family transcriptional regulator/heat shock protein HspR
MINPMTRSTSTFAVAKAPSHEIELFDPPLGAIYTIEATAHLVDLPRRTILVYCKHRLLSPAVTENGYYFDRQCIRALRRIEALRRICGDDLAGIKIILDLTDALERLHTQVRSLSRKSGPSRTQDHAPAKGRSSSSRKNNPKTNQRRKRK